MESLNILGKFSSFFIKYKYVLLVIIIGVILMFLPVGEKKQENRIVAPSTVNEQSNTETQLEEILSKVSGAGRVEVMLTTAKGEETRYQTDNNLSNDQSREDTVILTDEQRAQNGLITQINPPIYQGAIIVCDGANNPVVRLAIVEAVSKATGLGADKITVLKMN